MPDMGGEGGRGRLGLEVFFDGDVGGCIVGGDLGDPIGDPLPLPDLKGDGERAVDSCRSGKASWCVGARAK